MALRWVLSRFGRRLKSPIRGRIPPSARVKLVSVFLPIRSSRFKFRHAQNSFRHSKCAASLRPGIAGGRDSIAKHMGRQPREGASRQEDSCYNAKFIGKVLNLLLEILVRI